MADDTFHDKVFTTQLTNSVLIIRYQDGVTKVSVKNISAVVGTVQGTAEPTLNGVPTAPLSLAQGDVITITTGNAPNVLDAITITAPLGCTLQVIALV